MLALKRSKKQFMNSLKWRSKMSSSNQTVRPGVSMSLIIVMEQSHVVNEFRNTTKMCNVQLESSIDDFFYFKSILAIEIFEVTIKKFKFLYFLYFYIL